MADYAARWALRGRLRAHSQAVGRRAKECKRLTTKSGDRQMWLLFRLLHKLVAWVDFIAFTSLMCLLSWLPWPGKHPVARMFNASCRSFVRALDVDLRLHQKNPNPPPPHTILTANPPSPYP